MSVTKSPSVYYAMPNFIVRNKLLITARNSTFTPTCSSRHFLHIKLHGNKIIYLCRTKTRKNITFYVQLYIANPPSRYFYTLH